MGYLRTVLRTVSGAYECPKSVSACSRLPGTPQVLVPGWGGQCVKPCEQMRGPREAVVREWREVEDSCGPEPVRMLPEHLRQSGSQNKPCSCGLESLKNKCSPALLKTSNNFVL